jgi:hypothetical protein
MKVAIASSLQSDAIEMPLLLQEVLTLALFGFSIMPREFSWAQGSITELESAIKSYAKEREGARIDAAAAVALLQSAAQIRRNVYPSA